MAEKAIIEFSVVADRVYAKVLINKIKKTMRKKTYSPVPYYTDPLQSIDLTFKSGDKFHVKCWFLSMCIEDETHDEYEDWVDGRRKE